MVGIPLEWVLEDVYSNSEKIGRVLKVQVDAKGGRPHKSMRVNVEVDLLASLRSKAIINLGERISWV